MLASSLISIKVAPELAEISKLCPQRDFIIGKFNQLLARLTAHSIARNATDQAAYATQAAAIQEWLDVESVYRSTLDRAAKAREGASFAQGEYENWSAMLTATKKRQDKEFKDYEAEKTEYADERALILELLTLTDILQTEDTSLNNQAVLKQFHQKVIRLCLCYSQLTGLAAH